ncbi:MAG: SAM-dependent methyltransferase [Candidatus Aminicenantes bacterium]|nr:SAM-dependent methyltransferase [Candidatus Aminicenantes bacterium]
MKRRIESTASRTAEMTCISRACSVMEKNPYYKSGDTISPLLLPVWFKVLIRFPLAKMLLMRVFAPQGIYEYVIARTKYIDSVFKQALSQQFDQILILGAGFDTRALRFQEEMGQTKIFELDVSLTQQAKIKQYQKRHLPVPENLIFIPIDFDKESLSEKLDESGFCKNHKSLFVLEGLIMYLQPESVDLTFRTIQEYSGKGSWVVFDSVYGSVIRKEGDYYGENGIVQTVSGAGEQWNFGIEDGQIRQFLENYKMDLINQKDTKSLEQDYFCSPDGKIMGRINGTHFLVTSECR